MSRRSVATSPRRVAQWTLEQQAQFAARKRYELEKLHGNGDALKGHRLLLACERQAESTTRSAAAAAPTRAPRKRRRPTAGAASATTSRQRRSAARSAKNHAAKAAAAARAPCGPLGGARSVAHARWRMLLVGVRKLAFCKRYPKLFELGMQRVPRALPAPAVADAAQSPSWAAVVGATTAAEGRSDATRPDCTRHARTSLSASHLSASLWRPTRRQRPRPGLPGDARASRQRTRRP